VEDGVYLDGKREVGSSGEWRKKEWEEEEE